MLPSVCCVSDGLRGLNEQTASRGGVGSAACGTSCVGGRGRLLEVETRVEQEVQFLRGRGSS